MRYLTVMSIIAFRILFITFLQKSNEAIAACTVFTKNELMIISLWAGKSAEEDTHTLTLADAIKTIAKKVGFFGRKLDGTPGFQTIWKGIKKLAEAVDFYNTIRKEICGYF